jgi:hypothetical protein
MAPLMERFSDSDFDDASGLHLPRLALGLGTALERLSALDNVTAGKHLMQDVLSRLGAFLVLYGNSANEVASPDEALPDRLALLER